MSTKRLFKDRPATKDKTYISYRAMKQRCSPKNADFKYYSKIKVCNRWAKKGGYVNFLKDMGHRPDGMTLERINNNGNYEPSNCKWATRLEQSGNTKIVEYVMYDGVKMSTRQACIKSGIKDHSCYTRVLVQKCTHQESFDYLLEEKRKIEKQKEYCFGYTLIEFSRLFGFVYCTLLEWFNESKTIEVFHGRMQHYINTKAHRLKCIDELKVATQDKIKF